MTELRIIPASTLSFGILSDTSAGELNFFGGKVAGKTGILSITRDFYISKVN